MKKTYVLSPVRKNAYAPMFFGTLEEAVAESKRLSSRHHSRVVIFDATHGRWNMKFVVNVDPQ